MTGSAVRLCESGRPSAGIKGAAPSVATVVIGALSRMATHRKYSATVQTVPVWPYPWNIGNEENGRPDILISVITS